MSSALEPAPPTADPGDPRLAVTYLLCPGTPMSSGKAVAQVAHAAVEAAEDERAGGWVRSGCPGRVLAPDPSALRAVLAAHGDELVARIVDAGLTEVAPGTVTVVALAPVRAADLPAALLADSGPDGRPGGA